MEELPYKLKIDLAMEIHKNIYVNIDLFKCRDKSENDDVSVLGRLSYRAD
jgi:hypothetical protein